MKKFKDHLTEAHGVREEDSTEVIKGSRQVFHSHFGRSVCCPLCSTEFDTVKKMWNHLTRVHDKTGVQADRIIGTYMPIVDGGDEEIKSYEVQT